MTCLVCGPGGKPTSPTTGALSLRFSLHSLSLKSPFSPGSRALRMPPSLSPSPSHQKHLYHKADTAQPSVPLRGLSQFCVCFLLLQLRSSNCVSVRTPQNWICWCHSLPPEMPGPRAKDVVARQLPKELTAWSVTRASAKMRKHKLFSRHIKGAVPRLVGAVLP